MVLKNKRKLAMCYDISPSVKRKLTVLVYPLCIGNIYDVIAEFDLCGSLQLVTDMPRQQIQRLREEARFAGGVEHWLVNTPKGKILSHDVLAVCHLCQPLSRNDKWQNCVPISSPYTTASLANMNIEKVLWLKSGGASGMLLPTIKAKSKCRSQ